MKGFLGIKLSDKEYFPVLDLSDISVKKMILGKAPGEKNIKLDIYLSNKKDFINPSPVGSFFLENLSLDVENIEVYFKVENGIFYIYGKANETKHRNKFDLNLIKIKNDKENVKLNDLSSLDKLNIDNKGNDFEKKFEIENIENFVKLKDIDDIILENKKHEDFVFSGLNYEIKDKDKNLFNLERGDDFLSKNNDYINFDKSEKEVFLQETLGVKDKDLNSDFLSVENGESSKILDKNDLKSDNSNEFSLNVNNDFDITNKTTIDSKISYSDPLNLKKYENIQNYVNDNKDSERFDELGFSDINDKKLVDNKEGLNWNNKKSSFYGDVDLTSYEDLDFERIKVSNFLDDSEDLSVDDIIENIDTSIVDSTGTLKTIEKKNDFSEKKSKDTDVKSIKKDLIQCFMLYCSLFSLLLLMFFSFFLIFYKILKSQDLLNYIIIKEGQKIERYDKSYYG